MEVTQQVLDEFGIESNGAAMDPDPVLALDDAVRAFGPSEVLLSALYETRYGFTRRDLEPIEVISRLVRATPQGGRAYGRTAT